MTATPAGVAGIPSRPALAIACGGILAGIGDLLFAFVFYGMRGASPVRILQSVASGWLGRASFDLGAASATLGFFSHFLIAIGAAAVYLVASRWVRVLVQNAVLCGLAYGVLVYVVMNFVVIPLSAVPSRPPSPLEARLPEIVGHMVLVGLPIALAVRRFAK